MIIPIEWSPKDLEIVLATACMTIGFVAYWFLAQSPLVKRRILSKDTPQAGLYHILFQRYTGFVLLGVFPTIMMMTILPKSWVDYGVSTLWTRSTSYWILGLGTLALVISYINAQKADNLAMYPQVRLKAWTLQTFVQEYLSWIAYLVAYEFLFRGLFLYACVRAVGPVPAMIFNAMAYAFSHLPKGQKETVGAIPLGVLFSYITLTTGTIWVALIIHIVMALSNSAFSFYFQPEMHYTKRS